MRVKIGNGMLGLNEPVPTRIVRLPPPTAHEDDRRCGLCGRWLPPSKFESKGRRNGVQVRRTTCEDCRQFRVRALRPLLPATYGDTRGLEDEDRICKVCRKPKKVRQFGACSPGEGGEVYRSWTCKVCERTAARAEYRAVHWAR